MAKRLRIVRRVPTEGDIIAMIETVMAMHRANAELRMAAARPAAGPRRRVPLNWW
jgi:hypothetical protein